MDIAYAMVNNWNDSYLIPDYTYVIVDRDPVYLNSLNPIPVPKSYILTTKTVIDSVYNTNLTVYFPLNKYKIPNNISKEIKEKIKDYTVLSVSDVYGMASPEGSRFYNQSLSLKRAKSLASLFKNYDLKAIGLGECDVKQRSLYPSCRKAYMTITHSKSNTQEESRVVYSYDGVNYFDDSGNLIFSYTNSGFSGSDVKNVINKIIIDRLEGLKRGLEK